MANGAFKPTNYTSDTSYNIRIAPKYRRTASCICGTQQGNITKKDAFSNHNLTGSREHYEKFTNNRASSYSWCSQENTKYEVHKVDTTLSL